MKPETKGCLVIVALACLIVVFLAVVFANPKTTVRMRNDTSSSLFLECSGASPTVAPGDEVTIPMSVFNPFPCLVSERVVDPHGGLAQWTWGGCLNVNPLVPHATRLSQLISHSSLQRCLANAPR